MLTGNLLKVMATSQMKVMILSLFIKWENFVLCRNLEKKTRKQNIRQDTEIYLEMEKHNGFVKRKSKFRLFKSYIIAFFWIGTAIFIVRLQNILQWRI